MTITTTESTYCKDSSTICKIDAKQLPRAAHLSAEVEVQLSHHQAIPAARQAGRAAGIRSSNVAAAIEVAKILQGISKSSTCEQLHGEAMHIQKT